MIAGLRALLIPRTLPNPEVARTDLAWRVVVVGWAVLSVLLLGFILRYARNTPASDEWVMLAELTGEAPTLPWLWAPHNEHRYPLPRLIWVGLHRVSGYDFRAPMLLSVGLMAGTSLALLAAARRLRGRSHLADLLIPALLLHLGHWENWLAGYQLAFTVPVAAVGLAAAAMASGRVMGVGVAAVVAALCGGAGILLALPLGAWAAVAAVRAGRWVALAPPVATVVYAAAAVALRARAGEAVPQSTWDAKLATVGELLACGAGALGREAWPASGVVAAGVVLAALVILARAAVRSAADRFLALGLLAVLLGVLGVAGAIAASRTGYMPHVGFSPRYGLFAAIGLAAAYLAAVRFVPLPDGWLAGVGTSLAVLVVVASAREGVNYAKVFSYVDARLRLQAKAGVPPEQIADENAALVFLKDSPGHRQWLLDALRVLQRHRLGPYRPGG